LTWVELLYYPTRMGTIIRKQKKGRAYYYAVEARRVEGKPRIVWQKYLGTLEAIVARTEGARPPAPREAVVFEAGGVAALLGIAQRLGLRELIDEVAPKREQGPSVGHYMVLAALNRALAPCSKAAIAEWYDETVLRRLWRFPKQAFASQRFWDHMGMLSEEAIRTIEARLLPRVRAIFGVAAPLLLYDTTNFFTFLASANDRSELARRGHSKAKRHDLRQVGLALLVSRDFQVPLLHHTYAGNVADVTLFPSLAPELIARYRMLLGEEPEATLVFDKGNVSEPAMERLLGQGVPFVAALPSPWRPELLSLPLEGFEALAGMPGSRACSQEIELWGRRCQAVVVYSESFFTQQLAGVTQHLVQAQRRLGELQKSLDRWHDGKARGRAPSAQSVRASLRDILQAQFMKELIRTSLAGEGVPRLTYAVDHAALQRLVDFRLGRTILVSSRLDWDMPHIVQAYRSLAGVEEAFRNMKNPAFLHWQPAYHWTDQKLRVHAFYCVLALLLASLARKHAADAGIPLSLPALLAELSAIREVAVIYPPGTLAHRRDHLTLSRMTPRQHRLAEALDLASALKG